MSIFICSRGGIVLPTVCYCFLGSRCLSESKGQPNIPTIWGWHADLDLELVGMLVPTSKELEDGEDLSVAGGG